MASSQAVGQRRSKPPRRGPGRPVGGGEDTRDAVVKAALELFAARGYSDASAREIVERAGCTTPVLYHHFGNKAGLFAAVVREVNETVLGHFAVAITGLTDIREQIEAILDASVRMQEIAPAVGRFVLGAPLEVQRHPELGVAGEEMHRLGRFIAGMCEQARGARVAPDQVEYVVLTLIYGLSRMAASPRGVSYVRAVEALKTLLRGQLFDGGGGA